MAVQKDFMDSKALFKVLTEQRKWVRGANDFGKISLEMGMLKQDQVEELVESQTTTNELVGYIW